MAIGPETVLSVFLIFCRIGAGLMLIPGFSSVRIPVRIRLFIAIAVTFALAPLLVSRLETTLTDLQPVVFLRLIVSETMIGLMIGLMGRFFLLALQFVASAAAMFMGFGNMPGVAVTEPEAMPAVANFIIMTATLLVFVTDQHWEILRALYASYDVLPVATRLDPGYVLAELVGGATRAFSLGLQIMSPFLIYSLAANAMFGIANKLIPQLPIYFISMPFIIAGGLLLLYSTMSEALMIFIQGFAQWLSTG